MQRLGEALAASSQRNQDYLGSLLLDAIRCCGFQDLQVVKEATLFSLRPDLVVVLDELGRLLMAAEIKNPADGVFTAETAAGQCLDYLKALKQQGIDWPFVLLSTYNKTIIATLPQDRKKYGEILTEGAMNAKQQPSNRLGRSGML